MLQASKFHGRIHLSPFSYGTLPGIYFYGKWGEQVVISFLNHDSFRLAIAFAGVKIRCENGEILIRSHLLAWDMAAIVPATWLVLRQSHRSG